jgi:threonine dehydrogenase-like Zn-dependent dehydrogenase
VSSSGLSSKGRHLPRGVDKVPHRLAKTEEIGVDAVDFTIYTDIAKRIKELVPDGFDVAIDASTFHEPKTVIHKTGKALSLETDVSETLNETFSAVKKMGRIGIIAAYAGHTNGLNVGTVMEKGIRLIGNGQGELYPISLAMQSGEKIT